MKNYEKLRENYNEIFEYFDVDKKEMKSYFRHNIEKLVYDCEADTGYYYETNFIDPDTTVQYKTFREGYMYMFPRGNNEVINSNVDAFAISVSRNLKKISKEDDKFVVEIFDPYKKVVNVKFYDISALLQMEKKEIRYSSMDYIEADFNRLGIRPSKEYEIFQLGDKILLKDLLDSKSKDSTLLANRDNDFSFYQEYLDYFDQRKYSNDLVSKGFRL